MDSAVSFGGWLRRCRTTLGLTHAVLAERAHCSVSALRKIERDERHPSHRLAERLAACLQVPVAERARFVAIARGERRVDCLAAVAATVVPPLPAPSASAPAPARNNLPLQLTSFVGRERELTELRRLLGTTRLLTLTGAGGSGKTRLALRLAGDATAAYPDGICWVDLAVLSEPALVEASTAAALGLSEQPGRPAIDQIIEFLRPRLLLLLIDNCEHLIDASAALAQRLLGAAPHLHVLATSREALGVAGEIAWPVAPLLVPDSRTLPPRAAEALMQYEAVRLFVERAQLVQPDFALTDVNAAAVARICRQLDGIPLALELAAARVKLMTPEQIAERLGDRLLGGGARTAAARHRTLRAAIDWSYEQLSDAERLLLQRLAVFAGGLTLDAADAVCAGAGIERADLLDLLSRLVDKSLVIVEPERGSEARYRLLVTIRQYASEQLDRCADAASVRDRHRDYFLSLAERGDVELRGAEPRPWIDRIEQEHDNLRAAFEWSLAGSSQPANAEAGLRMAGALCLFWGQRGHLREGLLRVQAALASSPRAEPAIRALALHGAGSLAWRIGDNERAAALLNESLALRRELAVPLDLARTLGMLGVVYSAQRGPDDLGRAHSCFAETLPLARAIGDRRMITHSLNALGEVARMQGDLAQARDRYAQALDASRGLGDSYAAVILLNLGLAAFAQDEVLPARGHFEQSLALYRTLAEPGGVAACLDGLAGVHAVSGDAVRAAHLLGAADAVRGEIDEPVQPTDQADHERFVAAARSRLDDAAFATARAAGAELALDEAIKLALARG